MTLAALSLTAPPLATGLSPSISSCRASSRSQWLSHYVTCCPGSLARLLLILGGAVEEWELSCVNVAEADVLHRRRCWLVRRWVALVWYERCGRAPRLRQWQRGE